jgi:hypothetical protein
MKLRITLEGNCETTVRVDGELRDEGVEELREACASALPTVLDLSGLLSVDEPGLEAIRRLADEGMTVRGASPYVAMLLHRGGGDARGKGRP